MGMNAEKIYPFLPDRFGLMDLANRGWQDRLADMVDIHARLDPAGAIGLRHAARHPVGHVGGGITDVDLATGNVPGAAIERGGFGEAGDGVFGGGIGR